MLCHTGACGGGDVEGGESIVGDRVVPLVGVATVHSEDLKFGGVFADSSVDEPTCSIVSCVVEFGHKGVLAGSCYMGP